GQEITITLDVGEAPAPDNRDHVVGPPAHEETQVFPPPTGAIILGGLGVVGIGTGIGFALASSSKRSDFDSQNCAAVGTSACKDLRDSGTMASTVSWIGYIGGGALLAGGIVWWIAAPRKREVASVGVSPMTGPGIAGLHLQGRF
ncbi:MAG: hypothetical protein ACRELY_32670, partial [Polyangiaceae bacterium]